MNHGIGEEERLESSERYRAARERQQRLLEAGLPLGTNGQITWRRDDLHERLSLLAE